MNVVEAKEEESKVCFFLQPRILICSIFQTGSSEKLQTRIAELEAEVSRQSDIVSQVDAERRQSVQEITEMNQKMFKHIVEAEKQASETVRDDWSTRVIVRHVKRLTQKEQDALTMAELRKQVETLTTMLDSEQDRSRAIDRERAGSIKFLSNQRLKDLIEVCEIENTQTLMRVRVSFAQAESEFMAEIENWKKRVADLETKVSEYQRREMEANQSETKEEEVNEVTPGGPNEEEYLMIIAKLQEQLLYSNQSKIELLQSTNGEIDQLRFGCECDRGESLSFL